MTAVADWWTTNSGVAVVVLGALVFLWLIARLFRGFTVTG